MGNKSSNNMKTINSFNLTNKTVLLRVDINSDVKNKKIIPSQRLKVAAKTISILKRKKAKIVVIAHQGNPRKPSFISLKQHSKHLKIKFVKDIAGKKAKEEIKSLKLGEAILLENIRFHKDEFFPRKRNNALLKNLAPLFDIYIDDAFSNLHRDHTSMTGFPRKIKKSCIGPSVEAELKALENIKTKKCLYILGGAKPESDIKLLKSNKILATGLFSQVCYVAKGKDLGYQNNFLKKATLVKSDYEKFLKKLKSKLHNTTLPKDYAVNKNEKRTEYNIEKFPQPYEIEDIGKLTIQEYKKQIRKAKAIYMKGPAGLSHDKRFAKGTVEILKELTKAKAYTILGGGHLTDTIHKYKIKKANFNHVSLSGGALLNFIAGEKLVGLEVLDYYS